MPPLRVLGVESSCDETAASVVELGEGGPRVCSEITWSQEVHARWGGVVPEVASRAHVQQVVPVVRAALAEAGLVRPDLVAATAGPGLIGAVLVGLNLAKAAALGWGVPFVAVHHLEGHLLSALLEPDPPSFPFLALVVSGGHTTLYRAEDLGRYEVLAETVDDAVGEAYDKVARMLGLGYPGGPKVDTLAQGGDPTRVPLPRPRVGDLDMSFSGLKTAVLTAVQRGPAPADVAAAFQAAVCDVLADRVLRASERTGIRTLVVGGGVAANGGLRARLQALPLRVHLPPRHRCTDNASMIALTGGLRWRAGLEPAGDAALSATARPRWEVGGGAGTAAAGAAASPLTG